MFKLHNVNTTDLRAAIELGCQTMSSVFNADDQDFPFFGSQVLPVARLSFNDSHGESHVPGRHLNALLTAESALGITIAPGVIEKHARAAFYSYSGVLPLPLNRTAVGGPLTRFLPHNVREGFHALYALIAYRQSAEARDLAERSIACINELWSPAEGWDQRRLEGEFGLQLVEWGFPFMFGLARAIGPLVKIYRVTGYQPALDLALVLKDKAIAECFTAAGQYDRQLFGTHVHSTTCVMSSLAQLAELTADAALMQRVRLFYDNGLKQISDALGWSLESSKPDAPPDRGECNNTGDMLETALILGRLVDPAYYHDAERILRGHLLPSQLRDIAFIQDPPNPDNEDGKHDVARRHLGAFGFPAPYGHQPLDLAAISFNLDIVGGTVASLCEAYRAVVRAEPQGVWLNLLFDHETDALRVESPYTHDQLTLYPKRETSLHVRIPPWLDPRAITIEGASAAPELDAGYLVFPAPAVGQPITLRFALPTQELSLEHRTRAIRVRLRGDAVLAMENFGADLTFFDALEG